MATTMSPSEALAALARCCQPSESAVDPASTNDVVVSVVRLMEKGGESFVHQLGTVGCNYLEQMLGIYQTSSVVCLNVLNSLNLVVNLTGGLTARNSKKVSYRQYLLTRGDSCQLVLGALFAHLDNVFVVSQGMKLLNALTSDESLLAKLIAHMTILEDGAAPLSVCDLVVSVMRRHHSYDSYLMETLCRMVYNLCFEAEHVVPRLRFVALGVGEYLVDTILAQGNNHTTDAAVTTTTSPSDSNSGGSSDVMVLTLGLAKWGLRALGALVNRHADLRQRLLLRQGEGEGGGDAGSLVLRLHRQFGDDDEKFAEAVCWAIASLASTSNTDDEDEEDDDELEGSLVGGEGGCVALLLSLGASEVVCQALRRHTLRHKRHFLQQQQAGNVPSGTAGSVSSSTFSHHSARLAQEGARAIRNLFFVPAPASSAATEPAETGADGSATSSSSTDIYFSREEEACAVLLEAIRLHTSPVTNSNNTTNNASSSSFRSSSPLPPSHPSPSSSSPSVLSTTSALAVQWGWFAVASLSTTPRRATMLCHLGACDVLMDTLSSVVATGAGTSTISGSGSAPSTVVVTSDLEALGDVLQWTFAAVSAIVNRDPANSSLRLFFPQSPQLPQSQLQTEPGQNEQDPDTTSPSSPLEATTSSSSESEVALKPMEMVTCGQSRAQTLVQAASLLLQNKQAPPPSSAVTSALTPSSSSSSSSLQQQQQQQREEVAEEVSGALHFIISALRANTDSNNGHLLALSLLVSCGVVETLARLLQYAVHQPPAAASSTMTSMQSPAVPESARHTDRAGEGETPLVVARCVRALALLTQDDNDKEKDAPPMMLDLRGWLRAVSEESIARCVTPSSKQRTTGGLIKMLCTVVLRYSHCQHNPPSIDQGHRTVANEDQEERVLHEEDNSDEGQRSVAVWGVAVLLDILVCTRRDLTQALEPQPWVCGGKSLAHYIQLAGNANTPPDATATTKAIVSAATSPTPSSWLLGAGGDGGSGERARAQAASVVRGKLLQGGVAASLSAVLRAHIEAVVKSEQAHALAYAVATGGGIGAKSLRDQQLWPSTVAAASAARAMGLLLTLTLHTTTTISTTASSLSRPSPSSTTPIDAIGAGSSSLSCMLGQGTMTVVDLDSGSTSSSNGGGTLAAHTSLRKAGCYVELAQVVAVHSNNKSSSLASSSSSPSSPGDHENQATASRLQLLHLLLETCCAFIYTPDDASNTSVPDAMADSEAWLVATMGREALVAAGMGEAVVLVADGLLTSTTMMTNDSRETGNNEAPLQLLTLCCRVVALLAGPPSSSSNNRSSRFLYPPAAVTKLQQQHHNCCDQENDDNPPEEEELLAVVNLTTPTLSSLGLLVTPTPISIPHPQWDGVPWGQGMGLEPFSTRLFQTDLRKTLSLQASGSAVAAACRLRASGCCETIVQMMARAVQLLREEADNGDNDCDGPSVLLLWCCEAVSALCAGVDGRLGGHDSGLDYGYTLGVDCLDDDDASSQLGGDVSGGQGQGQGQGCRSLFKSAGLCPLLVAALEMVCDGRDRGNVYASSSASAGEPGIVRIPLAATAAALCRAVGSLALANESPGNINNNSGSDGVALAMLLGRVLEGFSLCRTHRQPQWGTSDSSLRDDDDDDDGNDDGDDGVSFDDRLHLRLDVTACEEAFRALAASTSSAWSSSALAETVVRSARRLIGQRSSCIRAACLALAQLALRHGRETAKIVCAGVGLGLARIAVCYASQDTNQPAENNGRSLASSQDLCVVWCRLVFALAHALRGDFFGTLLTTANRKYTSVRARRPVGVDDISITSGKETDTSAAAAVVTLSTGWSTLLLSLASAHETSCLAAASIAMATTALLDAATSAAAVMDVAGSSPHTDVGEVHQLSQDAFDLLSSPCLLSLTDVCVTALKKHSSPLAPTPSKWLSSLVQGVANAIVKVDPSSSSSSSTAMTAQAALVTANQAAAAGVTYWSALCLYKLLALPHPVTVSATDGSLVTTSSSTLPADMRSRLLAKGAVDAIMTALLGHKSFCVDQETVVAALLMVLFAAFSCPVSNHDHPDSLLDDSCYDYGSGTNTVAKASNELLEGVMGGLRAKAVGSHGLCDKVTEALRRHPSSRQVAQWSIAHIKLLSRRAVNVHKLCSANACETLPITLQHHQQDPAVAQAGCDIVCLFIHPLPLPQTTQPVPTPILGGMDPLESLLARPLHVSKATASSSASYAARLGTAGGCEAVVGVLRIHGRQKPNHHSHNTVVASAARAVSALACLSVENSAWLASIGVFEELLACWQVHASDPSVSAAIIGAIADLLLLPVNRTRLANCSSNNTPSSPSSSWVRALLLAALRQHSPPLSTTTDVKSSSLSSLSARREVVVGAAAVLAKMQQQGRCDDDDLDDATSSSSSTMLSVLTGAVEALNADARVLCRLCGALVSEMGMEPARTRARTRRSNGGMLETLFSALDTHLRAAVTATTASTDAEGHGPALLLSVLAVSGCLDALAVLVQQAMDGDDGDVRDRVRQTVLLRQLQPDTSLPNHVSLWLPEALRIAAMLLTGGNASTITMMMSSYATISQGSSSSSGSHSHSGDNDVSPPVATPKLPPPPPSSTAAAPSSLSSSFFSSFSSMIKSSTVAGNAEPNNSDSTCTSASKSSSGSMWSWGKAMVQKGMVGLRSSSGQSNNVVSNNSTTDAKSKDGGVSGTSSLVALALARSVCRMCSLLLMLAADDTTTSANATAGSASEDACTPTTMSTLSLSGMLGEHGVIELLLTCLSVASQHPLAATAVTTEGGMDWERGCLLDVSKWAVLALSLMTDSPSVDSSAVIDGSSSSISEMNVRRVCFWQRSGTVLIAALQVIQHHQQQQRGSDYGGGVHNVLSVMLAMACQRDHSKMGLLKLLGGFSGSNAGGSNVSESTRLLCRLLVRALHHASVVAIAAEGQAQALGIAPVAMSLSPTSEGDDNDDHLDGGERGRAQETLLLARVSLLLPMALTAVFVEHGGLSVCGALGRCGNAIRLVGSVSTIYVVPQATKAITALVAHIMTTTSMTTTTSQTQQAQPAAQLQDSSTRSSSPMPGIGGTESSSVNQDNDDDDDNDDGHEAAMDLSGDSQGLGLGQGVEPSTVMHHHRLRRIVVGGDAIRRVLASTISATTGDGGIAQDPPSPLDGFDCLMALVAQLCLAIRCLCLDADNKDRFATATVASSSSSSSASAVVSSGMGHGSSVSDGTLDSSQAASQQQPTLPAVARTRGGRSHAGKGSLLEALLQSLTSFKLTAESSALFLSESPSDDNNNINDSNSNAASSTSSSGLGQVQRLCGMLRRLTDEAAATITVLKEAQLSAQQSRGGIKSTSGITSSAGRAFSTTGGSNNISL